MVQAAWISLSAPPPHFPPHPPSLSVHLLSRPEKPQIIDSLLFVGTAAREPDTWSSEALYCSHNGGKKNGELRFCSTPVLVRVVTTP